MAMQKDGFYYNGQIARYVTQFMAIFGGLQVQVGNWNDREASLIPVSIHYGHMDRVVAALKTENTHNKPLRLPVMSAYISGLSLSMQRARGVGSERRQTYTPVGGIVPDDMRVIHQRMPVPYNLTIELNIFVSNTNQHLQIMEQILPLFDPSLNIQTSDAVFDWTRLTHVELKDIQLETNFPIGTDKRIIQSKITFEMPIELDTPAQIRRDFIERIYSRIGIINTATERPYDIIGELDSQNIAYEKINDATDLPWE